MTEHRVLNLEPPHDPREGDCYLDPEGDTIYIWRDGVWQIAEHPLAVTVGDQSRLPQNTGPYDIELPNMGEWIDSEIERALKETMTPYRDDSKACWKIPMGNHWVEVPDFVLRHLENEQYPKIKPDNREDALTEALCFGD